MSFENPQAFLSLLLGCVLVTSAALHSTAALHTCRLEGWLPVPQHLGEWDVPVHVLPERVPDWNKAECDHSLSQGEDAVVDPEQWIHPKS